MRYVCNKKVNNLKISPCKVSKKRKEMFKVLINKK